MKKVIIAICMSLFIVAAVVMLKNCFSYAIPNDAMGIQAVIARGQVDQLFLGSSAYRKGIDIRMVEREVPGDSFVVTYNGNQPFNMVIELREMIEAGTEIGLLIADFNPSMADRGADLSDKRLLWDTDFGAKLDLWKEIGKREDASFFTFYDFWVLSNNEYMMTYPIAYPLIAGRYYLGGGIDEDEGSTKEALDRLEVIEAAGVDDLQMRSMLEIVELCNENEIKLLFVEFPRYVKMEEDTNYQEKVKILEKALLDVDAEYVLGSDLGFDNKKAENYIDLTHMSSIGKQDFTSRLLQFLEQKHLL